LNTARSPIPPASSSTNAGRSRSESANDSPRREKPVRRPTRAVDGDVKMWIARGYSLETATAMAEQMPSVPSA
jgi:hypothetical protein